MLELCFALLSTYRFIRRSKDRFGLLGRFDEVVMLCRSRFAVLDDLLGVSEADKRLSDHVPD